ncbi:hypothetical protein GCM10010232_71050 [Streptomyces amakusaensis]|uniref:Uncharacterized protein n=1 Tax=Streptomyces amakusaensis TaxID=67271 RepID=A0ABW0ATG3_9ACTN
MAILEAGLVAVAAAKAVDTARERVTEYLLAARLEQLYEQNTARAEQVAVPWAERLAHLAARPLDVYATGVVIAWPPS